ncbi:protein-L-isoaspartate(D-aspartate) O-methyltransferase [Vreelandella alkaliphila]|uniref:Protein-L-isoaspartate O-methyltransferase n=1 Tax=Halomonas campaniensis TaxID=213554 RepID=A0A060B8H7_9GAMM|nr:MULTISPECIES: protein-L-isoaspartate(D-aspartate) O-methyltransferase [Halomonas]AIA73580.1 protein-L-isoaspartate O-methyltransferase [Halomonas campaniensis]ASK20432.1 protein-L-isoaspartate O-methyltransferase [Halomonas sp. N3-2A]AYF34209.1 protein-L-isoaspartate(D-aspartate) O-methyltransferase [Halomonas alkaliphila]MCD6004714.1 protein-L-isoaspartate(D-aspartate) O-methyltransferase [Halomonas sp. IOP_6]UTD56030.1 protein-L-isoaspartate(D-aspartate) O-methyltransferase [Halomonas sp.
MLLPELSPNELRGRGMTSQRTRDRMVERLEQQGIQDARVLDIMAVEPRHLFVDEALAHRAYEDTALPIGFGQTLSQPLTVARMTELVLRANPKRVLEVGTGSGYQTLILSRLVPMLYSVERIYALHQRAAERLWRLDAPATLAVADGGEGWQEAAPFDVILLTACAQTLPEALLEQLSHDGVLIAPLEEPDGSQWLTQIKRIGSAFEKRRLEPVRFVPLLQGVVD